MPRQFLSRRICAYHLWVEIFHVDADTSAIRSIPFHRAEYLIGRTVSFAEQVLGALNPASAASDALFLERASLLNPSHGSVARFDCPGWFVEITDWYLIVFCNSGKLSSGIVSWSPWTIGLSRQPGRLQLLFANVHPRSAVVVLRSFSWESPFRKRQANQYGKDQYWTGGSFYMHTA